MSLLHTALNEKVRKQGSKQEASLPLLTKAPLLSSSPMPNFSLPVVETSLPTPSQRSPIYIPRTYRRAKAVISAPDLKSRRLGQRWRHGAPWFAFVLILFFTLVYLTPLGGAISNYTAVNFLLNLSDPYTLAASQFSAHQIPTAAPVLPVTTAPAYLSKSEYMAIARQDALSVGIDPTYFVNQIDSESGFNPNARSGAGAVGIAQFMPSTAAGLGIDPWDPIDALYGAARYMANLANQYGGDYAKALTAYNGGPGAVTYAVNQGGDNWMDYIPAETRNYIRKIMGI